MPKRENKSLVKASTVESNDNSIDNDEDSVELPIAKKIKKKTSRYFICKNILFFFPPSTPL